jgi:hypothetical protein
MTRTQAASLVAIIEYVWPGFQLAADARLYWLASVHETSASLAIAQPAVEQFKRSTEREPPSLNIVVNAITAAQEAWEWQEDARMRQAQFKAEFAALPENSGLGPEQLESKRLENVRRFGQVIEALPERKF